MVNITSKTRNVPFPTSRNQKSIRYNDVEYPGPGRFVKSVILEFLKTVFETLPEGKYRYRENMSDTEIVIADKLTFNLDKVDKRPALVTDRGALHYSKASGLNRVQERSDQFLTDRKKKTDILRGDLQVLCYGNSQTLQSEDLADMVFQMFNMFDDALKMVGFQTIYASSLGRETPIESTSKVNYIVTPVGISYSVQRAWTIEGTNYRRLREIVEQRFNTN